MKKITIICGPTAGGKTDYAFGLAQSNNGIIINADSKQIFKDIKIIAASPSHEMQDAIPHYLYNFLESMDSYNVANYLQDVAEVINSTDRENIYIVGGTGMYIDALITGIADIPDIPADLRDHVRVYHAEVGNAIIYSELLSMDPETAQKLNMNDSQRILRAYEVVKSTGKSIKYWQNNTQQEGILQKFKHEIKVIMPDRPILYENCNKRFLKMLDAGGIDEVRALHAKKLSPQIFSAIGVRQIMNYLNREMLFEAMINDSQTKTRQYAKRQVTWFRRYIHI